MHLASIFTKACNNMHLPLYRLSALTCDNASNNQTLFDAVKDQTERASEELFRNDAEIVKVPCMAHVIQLCVNKILDTLKATPINDQTQFWKEDSVDDDSNEIDIEAPSFDLVQTLAKVIYLKKHCNNQCNNPLLRFVELRFLLTPVRSAEIAFFNVSQTDFQNPH